ncbi:SDR family oxidoreductase [Mucilaginibacter corticis]|uniref:SDR family oxidoreductase n=1 Tax=Mucilaginibacter corticis TaxID=2597670 RepID=A0A556MMD2_9SPHI|nr:SDR family oxidoreductase [Mucilaginibacter corticis]TSJ41063.1 SDR family oxidoreductase [Mucilaginibacter corticis]
MANQKNKAAVVTGGSGGIGYELALICAQNGYDLVLAARSEDKLEAIKKDLEERFSIKVHVFVSDLSEMGQPAELHKYCRVHHIPVELLINNAGYGDYQPVANADPATLSNMLHLNIIALTELTALFVKDMLRQKSGHILNIASTAAYQPVPRLAAYSASKAYVVSFTEALHAELKGTKVTATVLSPGVTETGFVDRAGMNASKFAQGAQANAADVAKAGYAAMQKGKLYVIPGFLNKLLAFSTRITPSRRLILAVSAMISK